MWVKHGELLRRDGRDISRMPVVLVHNRSSIVLFVSMVRIVLLHPV
jgi:hypothetical protein